MVGLIESMVHYGTEWDENIYDMVDEENIKFIAEILGVPEGRVENILSKYSDGWSDDYTEENETLIDEIRGTITDSFDTEI